MFTNYLKIAFRNLKKYKGYSFINILGLSIGMTCTILILLWVQDELSYDHFFPNAKRLYRVIDTENYSDVDVPKFSMNPPALAQALVDEYPEIKDAARLRTVKSVVVQYGEKRFTEDNLAFIDPSFLKMFSIPFVRGNNNTALSNNSSIILTQETAEKYFGNENPIGKTIRIDNHLDFMVTGVVKDLPHNSHLKIDFLLPFEVIKNFGYTIEGWDNYAHTTYVLLGKGSDYPEVSKKIANTINQNQKDAKIMISLQPITDIHLYSQNIWGIGGTGDIAQVYIFSIIAVLILLLACINFINLATARAGNRAKEVGMRKVVGARRKEIIYQFFLESIIYAFAALVISIILILDLLPVFNSISGKELTFGFQSDLDILLLTIGVALITGIISGSYPALILSRSNPVKVLKGRLGLSKSNKNFRKPLVIFQFSLTIILIIGTVVVNRQLHFLENKNLGFNKEQVLCIKLQGNLSQKLDLLRNQLKENRQVINISGVSYPPSGILSSTRINEWDTRESDSEFLSYLLSADFDFTRTMQIKMIEGRYFSLKSDTTEGCIVNQAAVKAMGMQSPVSKKVVGLKIIGVIKDFNFTSLHSEIAPLIIYCDPNEIKQLLVRIKPGDISQTIKSLEVEWNKVAPEFPFDFSFLDEQINEQYKTDIRVGNVINTFSLLALFIACLGMFGLVSFTAQRRTKEVGIRKILGASVDSIVFTLIGDFLKWVALANIIAWPIAWYVINEWLQNFAYRIDMSWWMFVLSGGIALLIAILTVGFQAIKAATANPVESLRYE